MLLRRFAIPYASQARSLKGRHRRALSPFKEVLIYHYDDFLDKAKAFLRSISPSWHSLAAAASLFILDDAGVSVLV